MGLVVGGMRSNNESSLQNREKKSVIIINYYTFFSILFYIILFFILKCDKQYIGETNKTLNQRFQQHKGYVNNKKLDKATGAHFNLPGHSVSDMRISVVEKIYNQDNFFRKEREKFYINKFHSKLKGLNRKT